MTNLLARDRVNLSPLSRPMSHCSHLGSRGGAVDALCSARRGPQARRRPRSVRARPRKERRGRTRALPAAVPGDPFLRRRARMPRLKPLRARLSRPAPLTSFSPARCARGVSARAHFGQARRPTEHNPKSTPHPFLARALYPFPPPICLSSALTTCAFVLT